MVSENKASETRSSSDVNPTTLRRCPVFAGRPSLPYSNTATCNTGAMPLCFVLFNSSTICQSCSRVWLIRPFMLFEVSSRIASWITGACARVTSIGVLCDCGADSAGAAFRHTAQSAAMTLTLKRRPMLRVERRLDMVILPLGSGCRFTLCAITCGEITEKGKHLALRFTKSLRCGWARRCMGGAEEAMASRRYTVGFVSDRTC